MRCKAGNPKHFLESTKSGRRLKLEGHGDNQYSWPRTYLLGEEMYQCLLFGKETKLLQNLIRI